MSFRRYYTGKVAPPGSRAVKVIVEIRRKEYDFRPKAIPMRRKGRKKKQYRDDKGGVGWERVKEVMMTPEGARMYYDSAEGQQILSQMEAWSNSVLGGEDDMAPSSLDEQVVNPADYADDDEDGDNVEA